ncbi:hypothetical protein [Nitrosospira multiformis]|uniref:hypothetical protein n=1 Tax=Nitrosospira multiformis TaxID=1231 RepID=UPI000D2FC090|nr:hypothetical protein [Nitrosospira multiformis]
MALLRDGGWSSNRALLTRLEAALGKLGMSLAARSKVSILKTDGAENPYGEFGWKLKWFQITQDTAGKPTLEEG